MKKRTNNFKLNNLSSSLREKLINDNFSSKDLSLLKDNQIMQVLIICICYKKVDLFKAIWITSLIKLDNDLLLKQSVIHQSKELVDIILKNKIFHKKTIEDCCVLSVKRKNKETLKMLADYAENTYADFSFSFKNRVCLRLAVNSRNLEIIDYLATKNINPLIKSNKSIKHLRDLILRDDEGWIDFYLENRILTSEVFDNETSNIFLNLLLNPKYVKGFYYAEKIILNLSQKTNSYKFLIKLFNGINYIYPKGVEEKVAPLRNSLRTIIDYKILEAKMVKEPTARINQIRKV